MNIDKEKVKQAIRMILEAIGENPDREGLRETPQRVADMLEEILGGYDAEEVNKTHSYKIMIICNNLQLS